jgi:chromosome segregation and condensation protein ScpB
MGRRPRPRPGFDRELSDLPAPARWREFMMRVEAVIFAASQPVSRETLCALIGSDCHLENLIADLRDELRARPYELVEVAGGFQLRTRRAYGEVIRASGAVTTKGIDLTPLEKLVLTAVAYFQPVTRAGLADILGRIISRDVIAALRGADMIATGPRSPQPGAPHTYVTTPAFLTMWGLPSLRDLPDLDRLEEAGLIGRAPLPDELRSALGLTSDDADKEEYEDSTASAADEDDDGDEDDGGLRWAEE